MKSVFIIANLIFAYVFIIEASSLELYKCNDNISSSILDSLELLSEERQHIAVINLASQLLIQLEGQDIEDCPLILFIKYKRGYAYSREFHFEKAQEDLLFLATHAEKIGKYDIAAFSNIELELVYEFMQDWPKCNRYLETAWSLIEKYELTKPKPQYFVRISSLKRLTNQTEDAAKYARLAEKVSIEENDLINLADAYFLIGKTAHNKDSTILYLKRSIPVLASVGELFGIGLDYASLSRLTKSKEQKLKYIDSIGLTLKRFEHKNKEYFELLEVYHDCKKEIFIEKSDIDSVVYHAEQSYIAGRQGIIEETNEKLATKEIEYNLEQAKGNLSLLQRDKKRLSIVTAIVLGLLALLGILMSLLYQSRKKIVEKSNQLISSNDSLKSLNRKNEVLLTEIHHRVKNNLQNIIGLINYKMQIGDSEANKNELNEITQKIYSISLMHDQLYQENKFDQINTSSYFTAIAQKTRELIVENKKVNIDIKPSDVALNLETTMPLGLMVSEFLTNSIKHNFDVDLLNISITVEKENEKYKMSYQDNGKGIGHSMNEENAIGTGLKLISTLSKQLRANLKIENNNGFEAILRFKEKKVSSI